MTENSKRNIGGTIGTLLVALLAGGIGFAICKLMPKKEEAPAVNPMMLAAMQPKKVEVAIATNRNINPPLSYMGHVEPIEDVDLRAQIEGTIAAVLFKEGANVKEGDLLYQIDPRVYEARVAQFKATLEQAKAVSVAADRYYNRMSKVDKRSVTETEVDNAYADMLQKRAAITQAEANLRAAEIDLGYTKIYAPISGRIGKSLLKKGDYVAPSIGSLVRIVQMDPVRVVFSVSDKDYVKQVMTDASAAALRMRLVLPTGDIYNKTGKLDFISNEMSAETASMPIRYSFENPEQVLLANTYVTVLVDEANPKAVLSIPTKALLTNAQGEFVYINEDGVAKQRAITIGAQQKDFVEVLSGLKEGDQVITDGVVNVNEGAKVAVIKAEK